MVLIRRSPIREMNAMQDAIDRIFEDTMRNAQPNRDALALDILESAEAYTVLASLPGVPADDINVTLHDNVLTISAEMPKLELAEGHRRLVQERNYGTFSRSIKLPQAIDADHVNAAYDNGVITLTLPKTAEAQPRQIKVSGVLTSGE